MRVLQAFGFGIGTAALAVGAVIQAARSGQGRPLAYLAGALAGLTALSGLFTHDLAGVTQFATLPSYVRTTGSLLLALYVTMGLFAAVGLVPLRSGLREGDLACRRYLLIYVGVLSFSVVYLYPAVWATGVVASVRAPGPAFTEFWEANFFHTPWLLGWQLVSWLAIIVLGRLLVNREGLSRWAILPADQRARRRTLLWWLAAVLALGTLGEAFRGYWYVWASTAAVLGLIALSLWQTWGLPSR